MKKYQPAVFQPTIRPSWSGSFGYIPTEELAEILKAIAAFPKIDIPESVFWQETIKPDLQQQYESFKQTCESRGRGARTYWGEHKLSISITQGNLCKDKDKDKDNINIKNNLESNKGGVGEKEKTPTIEEVLLYAERQNSIAGMGGFKCTPEQATDFFHHYAAQGWVAGNGIPIHNWQHKLREWVKEKYKIVGKAPRMSIKEIKAAENHIKLEKMLKGEL